MLKKIRLSKDKLIVFMGTMNAMPMMYALELKKLGYEVIYFVDVSKKDILSRPENHFPNIDYPYPSWIIELIIPSPIILPLFPRLLAAFFQRKIRAVTKKEVGCFVLNGFFSTLTPYLNKFSAKVNLSHGSDLHVWANVEDLNTLTDNFKDRSIFKYLPRTISRLLIKYIANKQYFGYSSSDTVVYFPKNFNSAGDKVIQRLMEQEVRYVPRHDISFEPLKGQSREFRFSPQKLEVLSAVRFLFRTFPEGNEECNKGNDIIIEGIAKYFSINPNICVHFVEKGEDVQFAKDLCRKLGIEGVVVWHKEMPFKELLKLYQNADVCFDQLGSHWIGAIGCYALWLGKPLIANPESAIFAGVLPNDHPICSAKTPAQVCESLMKLEDVEMRRKISNDSKRFVETYFGPQKALRDIFEIQC